MRRRKQVEIIAPLPIRVHKELPEVPGHFAANMLWLQTNSSKYNDRWVALYNGRLLVSGATREDLRSGIINHPYLSNIMILKVGQDYKSNGTYN